jgi:hypothetical protein
LSLAAELFLRFSASDHIVELMDKMFISFVFILHFFGSDMTGNQKIAMEIALPFNMTYFVTSTNLRSWYETMKE